MDGGVDGLILRLKGKIDYAICGHTHLPVTLNIDGCQCFNIGNDYDTIFQQFQYKLIEI